MDKVCFLLLQATVYCTTQVCSSSTTTTGTISCGPPMSNTRLYVLDGMLRPVPLGAPGQLFISGHSLARGYLGRPEETAKAFLNNPFASGQPTYDRMYASGDLARWLEDGTIQILGRVDNQARFSAIEDAAVLVKHFWIRPTCLSLQIVCGSYCNCFIMIALQTHCHHLACDLLLTIGRYGCSLIKNPQPWACAATARKVLEQSAHVCRTMSLHTTIASASIWISIPEASALMKRQDLLMCLAKPDQKAAAG